MEFIIMLVVGAVGIVVGIVVTAILEKTDKRK